MWWYENVTREKFEECKDRVEKIMEELGAERVDIPLPYKQRNVSISGSHEDVCEIERSAFFYKDEYYRVSEVLFHETPCIVIEAGTKEQLMNNIMEDCDPFPFDLSCDEMREEVELSLGIRDIMRSDKEVYAVETSGNENDIEFTPFDEHEMLSGEAPEFEIKRVLTREDFRKFFEFSFLKYRRGVTLFTLAFTVLMLFIGIRGRAVGMDMWWLFVLTAVLTVVYFSVYAARANRTNMNKAGRTAVYLFYSGGFVNRFGNEEARVGYNVCEAFEYGGRIFIIVNEKEGHILSVSDFPEPEKFRGFLRDRLGKNFK